LERWPNFFIVGVPKAGTTSLYEYLKDIPRIYLSPLKEPAYFSDPFFPSDAPKRKRIQNKFEYLKLFDDVKNEKVIGEATPSYMVFPEVPINIHKVAPTAKILISLRDPVERLFSSYLMHLRLDNYNFSFKEGIENIFKKSVKTDWLRRWLDVGLYYESVKRYLDIFGSKQVKIIIFEEWIKEPQNTIQEILDFLEIDYKISDLESEAHNPFSLPRGSIAKHILTNKRIAQIAQKTLSSELRNFIKDNFLLTKKGKPKMDEKSRSMLKKYYEDNVHKLENLLGRKLPWKNFDFDK